MRKLLEKVGSKIKGREYHIDDHLTTIDLLCFFAERMMMLLRGFFCGLRLKKKGKFLFVGKRVRIKYPGKISVGNGATISDGCIINAMSRKGITIGKNFTLGANSIIETEQTLTADSFQKHHVTELQWGLYSLKYD